MLETFTRNKKIWLIAIFVIIILVSLFVAGGYYSEREDSTADKQVIIKEEAITEETFDIEKRFEQTINVEKEKCMLDFDLDNLDFTKLIWNDELSTMLKGLLVMRAVDQKNKDLCNYEKREINSEFRKERCELDYNFFFVLSEKLKKGISPEQYTKECQESLLPYILIEIELGRIEDINIETLKEGIGEVCKSYYQSFENKAVVIVDPLLMCDGDPAKDSTVEYLIPQTKQSKICAGEFSDEIKFLITVAKNDSAGCLDIKDPRISQYCQFYFNRDLIKYQNKFKEVYCHSKIHNDLFLLE